MNISSYLDQRHVLSEFPAGERTDVLRRLVGSLVELGDVAERSVKTVLSGVLEREKVGSTGIGRGIAVPHTKTNVVSAPVMLFARMVEPIPYAAIDGAPVHSLFLVVSPRKADDEHLAIVKWVAQLARSDYYAAILKNTTDPASLFELFREIDDDA